MTKYYALFLFILAFANFDKALAINKLKSAQPRTCESQVSSQALVEWSSEEGEARLNRANKTAFFQLSMQFEPQQNKFYCGIASSVIVLNALRVKNSQVQVPLDHSKYTILNRYYPSQFVPVFARYTQENFFTSATDYIKTKEQVYGAPSAETGQPEYGLELAQMSQMLEAHGLKSELVHVDDNFDRLAVRQHIINALRKRSAYVIVNFDRRVLKQKYSGHISPLAAYDPQTDSVLVLDVNPTDQTWFWIDLNLLIDSMNTKDIRKYRGYIVVTEGLSEVPND